MLQQTWKPPPMFAPARVYFTMMVATAASGGLWSALFFYYEAFWTGVMFICILLIGLGGIVHATAFRQHVSWRPYMLMPIGLVSLGFTWSLGPEVSGYIAFPLLFVPHVICTTGGSKPQVIGSAVFFAACFVALRVLFGLAPISPEDIGRFPPALREVFCLVCVFTPTVNELGCLIYVLGNISMHKASLEDTIGEAELICRGLVSFDLDRLPGPGPHHDAAAPGRIVLMLYTVVDRMKQFRPFLPQYLLTPMTPRRGSAHPRGGQYAPSRVASELTSDCSSDEGPSDPEDRSSHKTSRKSSGAQLLPCGHCPVTHSAWRRAKGTLALIALPGLRELMGQGETASPRLKELSDAFFRVVVPAILHSRGTVISLSGDQCLAGWNMASRCASHVQQALTAATEIRDMFRQVPHAAAARLSIGVYADDWTSGSFGTQELRMYGLYTCQTARAVVLQRYAEATGRCIMVNDTVWKALRSAPTHQLLPVDVVDLDPGEGGHAPQCNGEVVSECLAPLSDDAEEWLYAVGPKHDGGVAAQLHHALTQLQRGIGTEAELRTLQHDLVQALVDVQDSAVQDTCGFVMGMLKAQEPYCVRPQALWGRLPRRSLPAACAATGPGVSSEGGSSAVGDAVDGTPHPPLRGTARKVFFSFDE